MSGVVYVCRDAEGVVIYVGQTEQWPRRMASHKNGAAWWPLVAGVSFIPAPDRSERMRLEAKMVAKYQPIYNTTHTTRAAAVRQEAGAKAAATKASRPDTWTYPEGLTRRSYNRLMRGR